MWGTVWFHHGVQYSTAEHSGPFPWRGVDRGRGESGVLGSQEQLLSLT